MRLFFLGLAAWCGASLTHLSRAAEPEPQYLIQLHILEAAVDTPTNRLAEPTIVTVARRPFSVFVGSEVPVEHLLPKTPPVSVGLQVDGRLGALEGDLVPLEIAVTRSMLEDRSRGPAGSVTVQSNTVRTFVKARIKETVRLADSERDGKRTWVELVVEPVRPAR